MAQDEPTAASLRDRRRSHRTKVPRRAHPTGPRLVASRVLPGPRRPRVLPAPGRGCVRVRVPRRAGGGDRGAGRVEVRPEAVRRLENVARALCSGTCATRRGRPPRGERRRNRRERTELPPARAARHVPIMGSVPGTGKCVRRDRASLLGHLERVPRRARRWRSSSPTDPSPSRRGVREVRAERRRGRVKASLETLPFFF